MSVNELQYVVYSGYLSYRSERKSVSLNANLVTLIATAHAWFITA